LISILLTLFVPSISITPPAPPLNLRGACRGYSKEEQRCNPNEQGVAAKYFSVNPSPDTASVLIDKKFMNNSG